jgi:protein O-GlcNAc transferase
MPDSAQAIEHATALAAQGRHDDALALLAPLRAPHAPEIDACMGLLHLRAGRPAAAVEHLEPAAAAFPDDPNLSNNLAHALASLGRMDDARAAQYRHLLALPPDPLRDARLAVVLEGQGDSPAAWPLIHAAIAAAPSHPEIARHAHALAIRWQAPDLTLSAARALLASRPADADLHRSVIWASRFSHQPDPLAWRAAHEAWAAVFTRGLPASTGQHPNPREPDRPLRVGYVSQEFHNRPLAHFFEPLLAHHDRARIVPIAYHQKHREDHVTARLKSLAAEWHDIDTIDDDALAAAVRAHRIDVLVDLCGPATGHRLGAFVRRPAPVQVTYLGYPGTTGLACFDARFTDLHADPPGFDAHTTEPLLRLAGHFLAYQPPEHAGPVAPPPSAADPARPITFGSFNTHQKVTPPALDLWAAVLRAVPGSRLVLKSSGLLDGPWPAVFRDAFNRRGIDPARLDLLPPTPTPAEHLATYAQIDIALDPFPYHGVTSTMEALWMGVPVVVLAGPSHRSRYGVSILHAAGLADLLAHTPDDYVRIAARLAADRPALAARRAAQRGLLAAAPITDGRQLARSVESALRQLWHAWCARR